MAGVYHGSLAYTLTAGHTLEVRGNDVMPKPALRAPDTLIPMRSVFELIVTVTVDQAFKGSDCVPHTTASVSLSLPEPICMAAKPMTGHVAPMPSLQNQRPGILDPAPS
jgi:hypothetical protein